MSFQPLYDACRFALERVEVLNAELTLRRSDGTLYTVEVLLVDTELIG